MSVLWCQGMFASGSTWLYNVALAVAAELDPPCPVQGRFVFQPVDALGLNAPGIRHVVKSHQARSGIEHIAPTADAILVTVRDPRDAVVSLMRYHGFSFARALLNVRNAAEACVLLGALPQAITLHYERGFVDDPRTIDGVARHLGGGIAPECRDRIFRDTRRPAIETLIARLDERPTALVGQDGDVYDRASHWHRHHAGRDGVSGRWRRLLYPAQIHGIETSLGDWMALFGYMLADTSLDLNPAWAAIAV